MIFNQLTEQLQMVRALLHELDDAHYTTPVAQLGMASIGQHTRHMVELLGCTLKGYHTGMVDYHNRERDQRLETDRAFAISALDAMESQIHLEDKTLVLAPQREDDTRQVYSSYHREVVYNTEHFIHHMALIKVALRCMDLELTGDNFGMAYATMQYKAQNMQPQEKLPAGG